MSKKINLAFTVLLLLTACSPLLTTRAPGLVAPRLDATQTATPFLPEDNTAVIRPTSLPMTPSPAQQKLFVPPSASPSLREAIQNWGMVVTDQPDSADAWLHADKEFGGHNNQFSTTYALVAPFPTVTDSVSFADLQNAWTGVSVGDFANRPLLMDQSTYEAMRILLGEPAANTVKVIPEDDLLDVAWADRPEWAVVPFESLSPKWKVLEVDGQSPLRKEFDPASYPLKLDFYCEGTCGILPVSNRDPSKLTTLIMTGTTALVRATANQMEVHGLAYPAQDIGAILRSADILHISNEISFADDCPTPDPNSENMRFCSAPKYIALLKDIGTDVVELTGNHVNDWGTQWLIATVQMYKDQGWGYFGGGLNLSDAVKPYVTESNGNRIAFIGCNIAGPQSAWATESSPGAAPCGDYKWMYDEISQLRNEGILPITTVQYNEYYQLQPSEAQARDFGRLAQAGAAAVSGSQSHFPQSFAFVGDSYVHYGPGNLFFDQMDYPVVGTRRAALDRYTIYDGKILGVELITTMLEDWSRPRLMTLEERRQFLQELFSASGW
jgi:Bacterial capsule synthesis protein PGA_cap